MKYGFMAVCVVVWSMAFVNGVRSEEADVKLPEVVVTATKTEKDPKDVTQSVTVITSDDIKKSGATTAGEAIQNTVGMRIRDNGPEGAEATVSIRGATSAQVLVLLDGRRLNSPRTGGYNLSDLPVPLDSIERIEIVRGPSSALYGADAAGGVVNIITKKPKESKTTAEASAGSHGYDLLAIRNQGSARPFSYSLSADRETSDGYRANSNLDQARTGGSIGYDFSADSRLDVRVDYLSKEQGVPGSSSYPSPRARQWTRETIGGAAYRGKMSKEFDLSVDLYRNQDTVIYKNPDTGEDDRHESTSNGVDGRVNWLTTAWNVATVGADARRDFMESTASGEHGASQWSGYLQDEISVGEALIVVLGGRYDSHSVYGDEFSPRASVRYLVGKTGTIFRGSAGKGFRAPTFYDLYFNASWGVGNPLLRPEIAKEYEGSIEQQIGQGNTLRLGAFVKKVKNLINWNLLAYPIFPENIGRAEIKGFEAEAKFLIAGPLTWAVNYTYMNPVNELTGEKIYTIPEEQVNTSVNLALASKTNCYVEGRMTRNYEMPGEGEWQYFVMDVRVTQKVTITTSVKSEVFFSIKNIFDRSYEAVRDYPMPPREIFGGMSVQF